MAADTTSETRAAVSTDTVGGSWYSGEMRIGTGVSADEARRRGSCGPRGCDEEAPCLGTHATWGACSVPHGRESHMPVSPSQRIPTFSATR